MESRFRAFRRGNGERLHVAPNFHPLTSRIRIGLPSVRWSGTDSCRIHRRDFDLTLDTVTMRLTGRCASNPYSLDTAIRVSLTALLLERGGALVHGAGLMLGRQAVLCPGKSGAGKSTLSRKAGRTRVLSDELTAVRLGEGGVAVSGTPFQGEFQTGGINRTLPLRGMFFLHRGRTRECAPLTPGEACVRLLRCCLFFDRSFDQVSRLLALARAICERTPSYDFAFSLDEPWAEIARRMRAASSTNKPAAGRPGSGRRSGDAQWRAGRDRSGSR